ncbi:MAG TPA: C4-type zinc ribbon domain-containing protein [Candidatus Lustribacter sp.]|nr:C4-type zinc ribbon domain-containing protein [Candidatus Lustribacter sp.]
MAATDLDRRLVQARTARDDIARDVTKADQDVQLVRDRAARDQARLDSGFGTAKDLQALQHELASLARRQGDLEDIELEVMERAEGLEHAVTALDAERAELAERIEAVRAERDAALSTLDDEAAGLRARRTDILPRVGEDLVTLYEKIRASSGGIGAAELTSRRCGGCRLELNSVDMNRIVAAPADEVLRCEECRRILVRTAESGIYSG